MSNDVAVAPKVRELADITKDLAAKGSEVKAKSASADKAHAEYLKLSKELSDSQRQLEALQEELRGAVEILVPGSLSGRVRQ